MKLGIEIETELSKCTPSTLRVWLNLIEMTEKYGHPLIVSFTEISRYSNVCNRVSRRAVGKGIEDLERLKMVDVERRGNVSVIVIRGLDTKLNGWLSQK